MTGRLKGQAAVITGGGNGIGRETVLRFLREGAKVVVADLNPENGARTLELAADEGHGDGVRFVRTDVTAEAEVRAAIECACDEFGRLDCVFNNAGIGGAFGPVTETQVEEWDFSMEVLVRGVFLGLKHGARVLKRQGEGGVLLSTASVAGLGGGAGSHCYSAAKAAVANLTRSVALEMAPAPGSRQRDRPRNDHDRALPSRPVGPWGALRARAAAVARFGPAGRYRRRRGPFSRPPMRSSSPGRCWWWTAASSRRGPTSSAAARRTGCCGRPGWTAARPASRSRYATSPAPGT